MAKIVFRSASVGRSTKKISSKRPLRKSSGGSAEMSLEVAGPVPAKEGLVDQVMERREDADRVKSLLVGLPEKQRLAVTLRIFEGLSFREIGEITESSEGSARVNYHHGIRRLREMLE